MGRSLTAAFNLAGKTRNYSRCSELNIRRAKVALNLEDKKSIVAEVSTIAADAHSAIAAEYRGLTCNAGDASTDAGKGHRPLSSTGEHPHISPSPSRSFPAWPPGHWLCEQLASGEPRRRVGAKVGGLL